MKLLTTSILAILTLGCAAPQQTIVDKDILKTVPPGTSKIVVITTAKPDEAFLLIAKNFAKSGCPVRTEKEILHVICEGRTVDESTNLKAFATVEPHQMGSVVTFAGEWGIGAKMQAGMSGGFRSSGISGTEKIVWSGSRIGRPNIAFQYLLDYALDLPDPRPKYER